MQLRLRRRGGAVGDIEPISRFHEVFQGSIDAAYAASVVGLEREAFLTEVRENVGLQQMGLLALDSANGSMKRDAWTEGFDDVIFALDFPETEIDSPSQPELLPGGVVHIPDTNLRTAIAEALGKSPNAPITAEGMKGLRSLRVIDAGIRDLTGLEYAINIDSLRLPNNQITDISPVQGLKNLTSVKFEGNQVPDISSLAELINLEVLELARNEISDISALAGLVNLRYLDLSDNSFSDISPVAGLVNLEHISFTNERISDISALAGLINLKVMTTWSNPISDISPLAGLTQLEKVDMCHSKN